jgi:hypothetical protein
VKHASVESQLELKSLGPLRPVSRSLQQARPADEAHQHQALCVQSLHNGRVCRYPPEVAQLCEGRGGLRVRLCFDRTLTCRASPPLAADASEPEAAAREAPRWF